MAVTNFSPLLGLALPTTGDLSGTWGTTVNDSITSLIDSAVAGTTTLSANADVTLSTTNGAANQARNAVILWTASNGATTRNITAPAQSKAYLVINSGTGSIVVRGSGPTTGVTIPSGTRALIAWNGSDFVKIVSNPVVLTTDVTGTLPIANGGTGTTSTTFANLATNVTGTLPVANGGTGTTTPALVAGTNVTITGSWPNQTINSSGGGGGSGTVTSVGMTVPTFLSVAGSPVTTSGTLAVSLSGTALPIANGGTGTTSTTFANLTTNVTGTLPVANGGTGASSLTANNVLLGNGTSAVQVVAPGSSGNVLMSNGTTWASTAIVAGGLTNLAVFTSSGTWTVPPGITRCKVTVTGGGGGAGNAYAGAAGGTAIGIVNLSGSFATITVGAGGAANTTGAAGTSSFVYGAITVSATGGTSGNTGTSFSPTTGGGGSGGDINVTGGPGAALAGITATGGASFWGGGDTWTGASAYGSGGGWYTNIGTVAGRSGIVVIEF
jgi:hypothetical protein